jgi:hypothetical protein
MNQFLSGRQQELKVGIVSYTENKTVLSVTGNTNVSGILTASGGFNLGISSAGTSITSGPITRLNFIGAGNTFAINGTTIDVSIAGGGGGASVSISTVAPSTPSATYGYGQGPQRPTFENHSQMTKLWWEFIKGQGTPIL